MSDYFPSRMSGPPEVEWFNPVSFQGRAYPRGHLYGYTKGHPSVAVCKCGKWSHPAGGGRDIYRSYDAFIKHISFRGQLEEVICNQEL